jgi:hypothetical protein
MSDIIETEVKEGTTEYKTIVTPSYFESMLEAFKHKGYGWDIDPERPPFFSFIMYEVHLIRNANTIAKAKQQLESAESGRDVMTKEKRQEIMAKARAAKKINKGDNSEDQG